uniref:C-type lectin domain-containing protein n=1 Tax=Labrus bergylta TaxID=56723 RepID=A0A3Q3MP40_9LABR
LLKSSSGTIQTTNFIHRKLHKKDFTHSFLFHLSDLCSLFSCESRYLQLFHDKQTWSSAQKYCRKNCVDLATIYDMDEMQTALRDMEGSYHDAWIGLQTGTRQRWHWSLSQKDFYKEGERNYRVWGVKRGDYSCGAYANGKFEKTVCSAQFYAVCFAGEIQLKNYKLQLM